MLTLPRVAEAIGVARGVDDHRRRAAVVEHVVDVVVDPFADEHHRLAPSVQAGHEVGELLQRLQHVARVLHPLERQRIVDRVTGVARAARLLPVVLVEPLERRRPQLAADELVDRGEQQPRVVGELLRRPRAAAGEDHGGQIVGAEVPLEEAVQRFLHARPAREIDVQIVEHEQIDASVHADVRLDVGLDRRRREQRTVGRAIGMFTYENALTFCGLPSSRSWKSLAFRSVTGLPVASLTNASTSTRFASTRNVSGGCSGCCA